MNKMIESLAFYFNKYRPEESSEATSAAELRGRAHEAHARAFDRECLRIWGFDQNESPALVCTVVQPLRRYYSTQQKCRINYKHGESNLTRLPTDLTVLEQVSYDGSTALLCDDLATGKRVYWLEGVRMRDKWLLFDSELPIRRAIDIGALSIGGKWTARLPVTTPDVLGCLNLPQASVSYEAHY